MHKTTLSFYGGVGSVTGANFLLAGEQTRLLVDCGLIQGERFAHEANREPFAYDPVSIDYLLVTHAHIDHIGRIPKLVKDGFIGKIFSTPQTLELSRLMLPDAFSVLRSELPHGEMPMYDEQDIEKAFSLWKGVPLHQTFSAGEFEVVMKDSGHILGSVMFVITRQGQGSTLNREKGRTLADTKQKRSIVFTGDLGNAPTPLLNEAETVAGATYLVLESVYGDRNHEGEERRKERLAEVIRANAKRGGVLLIPCFSLEKTQVLLYEMDDLLAKGQIPKIPVFLDSPLAIKVTDVYRRYAESFNEEARARLRKGDDIFSFPSLRITMDSKASSEIVHAQSPKIIIAGSGMSAGGRILDHEQRFLGDPKNTILFIGYQAVGSLGRQIQEGVKKVRINHEDIHIRARVETITGYSSHMDSEHLLEFSARAVESGALKKVFVVMGEPRSALFLAQRIRDYAGVDANVPELGESVEIEL
ncbi:MAG: Beta-lactamase domain protein [Parcubacteria group bacterium GW2011_GWA2_47_64]|nr:MAG: Beta-lactamase domain protein [Parcubacteria group bacterium GW2011_GWA2_47_64]KKU96928.1 MAG: Beta-lactamase domain protein [Parcubacteria group bacterium GW2011_GWC2_48_17]